MMEEVYCKTTKNNLETKSVILMDLHMSIDLINMISRQKHSKPILNRTQNSTFWVLITQFRRSTAPGHNDGKVIINAPSAYNILLGRPSLNAKGRPFRLSYGYQIPHCEWGRNGSRRSARSQGVLLGINETKRG